MEKVIYNKDSQKFTLLNGSLHLDSRRFNQFSLPFEKVKDLNLSELPDDIRILFEYNIADWLFSEPIRVYVYYEVMKYKGALFLNVIEKSKLAYWSHEGKMHLYYHSKIEHLHERQKTKIDLVVNDERYGGGEFLIKYVIEMSEVSIVDLLQTVHLISGGIEKGSFMISIDPYLGEIDNEC